MHSVIAALAFVFSGTGAPSPTEVVVDATRIVQLGETREISANMFGITAFEGFPRVVSDPDYRASIEVLRPGCFRFPSPLSWFAPATFDPKWYQSSAAARQLEETLLYGSRYPVGRFFRVARQMGCESMITLNGPPKYLAHEGNATHLARPGDFDRWAEYCVAFVGLCKSFDPKLRLVQVWNEPNADWFNDPRAREKGPAKLFIEMTNKVAAAMKRRYPDVLVGGPTLCWPPSWPPSQIGQSPWYTWEGWTLPWLRETKETVDFFDFHDYTASPEELAVQVEMLHAAAVHIQGRRLPIWITESNAGLAKGTVSLPARATASISLRMDQFGRLGYRRTIREHFGDRTFQFLKRGEAVNIGISMPETKKRPQKVTLRIGLLGPDGRETFTARLNGREMLLKAAILQDIPLDAQHLHRENQLQVTLRSPGKNDKLAIGFVSIVIQDEE